MGHDSTWVPHRDRVPWVLIGPVLLLLAVFHAYPIVFGGYLSLTDTSLLAPYDGEFVGLDNYRTLFVSGTLLAALVRTVIYAATTLIGALVLGTVCALALDGLAKSGAVARSLIAIPWAAPQIAIALVFTWMFNNQYGVINYGLQSLGIVESYPRWFDNPTLAMPALIAMTIWMLFPFVSLVVLASLQSLPQDIVEASSIDGARGLSIMTEIRLPWIKRTLLVLALFMAIWSVRRFEILWVITQGGPADTTSTLTVELYREAFSFRQLGSGAAIGVVGVLLSILVVAVFLPRIRKLDRA